MISMISTGQAMLFVGPCCVSYHVRLVVWDGLEFVVVVVVWGLEVCGKRWLGGWGKWWYDAGCDLGNLWLWWRCGRLASSNGAMSGAVTHPYQRKRVHMPKKPCASSKMPSSAACAAYACVCIYVNTVSRVSRAVWMRTSVGIQWPQHL